MNPKTYELQVLKDYNKPQRRLFFMSSTLFVVLSFINYIIFDDGGYSSILFLVGIYVFFSFLICLRKTNTHWLIFQTFIDFKPDGLEYKMSSIRKSKFIDYASIEAVTIKK